MNSYRFRNVSLFSLSKACWSSDRVFMDVQEAKLREKMQGTGVSVTRSGDNIILNMPTISPARAICT